MPALTHGRVKNGFNLLPRTITYAQGTCNTNPDSAGQNMEEPDRWQNGTKLCKGSQRSLCCGRPMQYTNMKGKNVFRNVRIPTGPENVKLANTVATGRSFAAKRAIARRTATGTKIKNKDYPNDPSKAEIKYCCLLPTATYSRPVMAHKLCTNPTQTTELYRK